MLRFIYDPPAVGDLGRIVGASNLIVKQLASGVPHHAQQLRAAPKQVAGLIQFLDPGRQRPQERREPLGPLLAIYLIMLCHRYLEGTTVPSVKFRQIRPIKIMNRELGVGS